jgi:hypothetical protein
MWGARAQAAVTLLLLGTLLVGLVGAAASATEPALLIGVLGALLCAWGVARHAADMLPRRAAAGPAAAARQRRRALERQAVPRQRDPDAPGRTRSRAPSGILPAV